MSVVEEEEEVVVVQQWACVFNSTRRDASIASRGLNFDSGACAGAQYLFCFAIACRMSFQEVVIRTYMLRIIRETGQRNATLFIERGSFTVRDFGMGNHQSVDTHGNGKETYSFA